MLARLRGDVPLPWADGELSPDARARIGELYAPLMQLLDRDPARRPSAAEFCDQCMAIASSATNVMLGTLCGTTVSEVGGASQLGDDSFAL